MTDEPQRYSIVSIKIDSSDFSWEKAKLLYSDGYSKEQAENVAEDINTRPGHEAFAIPVSLRKHYFNDLLESLRLTQSEYTK